MSAGKQKKWLLDVFKKDPMDLITSKVFFIYVTDKMLSLYKCKVAL